MPKHDRRAKLNLVRRLALGRCDRPVKRLAVGKADRRSGLAASAGGSPPAAAAS